MYRADVYRCCLVKETTIEYGKVNMPDNVIEIMGQLGYRTWSEEYLYLFCLGASGQVLGIHEISHGTINASICSPKDIFKRALNNNATAVITTHNHPSGNPTPSKNDFEITRKVVESGKLLDIDVLDHIILGDRCYYSFREQNKI